MDEKSFVKTLNIDKKQQILCQNQILSDYLNGEPNPSLITRDNKDHLIAMFVNERYNKLNGKLADISISAKILGKNAQDQPVFMEVGKAFVDAVYMEDGLYVSSLVTSKACESNGIRVGTLVTSKAFRNNGIGSLILKTIENYSLSRGIKTIILMSAIDPKKIKGTNNYYDYNLKFYLKNGYQLSEQNGPIKSKYSRLMTKTLTKANDLRFGDLSIKPCLLATDPRLALTEQEAKINMISSGLDVYEPKVNNSFIKARFLPSQASTDKLKELLSGNMELQNLDTKSFS